MESQRSSHSSGVARPGQQLQQFVRWAGIAGVCLAGALALPVQAADPILLPGVEVSASRNPGETPVEAAYTTVLSQRLAKNSTYPTGRDASVSCPSGTATVWVELARSGKVVGKGIESSSKSQILDDHAVELAARARYPALPADAWADTAKHRFVVSYRFDCSNAKGQKKG